MGKRWAIFLLVIVLIPIAISHKNPIIEYTYVGNIWEESYTTIPRQPVVNELITLKTSVVHPGEVIEGNVSSLISIYEDHTVYKWYGGKSYKNPDWLLLKEAPGQPEGNNGFTESVIISQPGSYRITIDWYEDNQYLGQSMHMLDVETRTLGPLFYAFNAMIILGVLIGVRKGIL